MFKNYALVTLRNLFKHRVYSFINIFGLAIGICCATLILLWVQDETSYDTFLPKNDRLYQVYQHQTYDGEINTQRSLPLPAYRALKNRDNQIVNTAVSDWGMNHLLTVENKPLTKRGFFVSREFLEMFRFPLLKGDASQVLDDPYSIVITQSMATTFFGNTDPVNRMIRFEDQYDLKVTGVLKDLPGNSSFEFEYLIPWSFREANDPYVKRNTENWGNNSFQVYAELRDPEEAAAVNASIERLIDEHEKQSSLKPRLFLHPLPDWRLHSEFENGVPVGGQSDYVKLFTIIGIFILVIACINFMNLATARSERRAREVGVRKAVGSNRANLVAQFMGESFFITLIAYLLALLVTLAVLPAYNNLVDKDLYIDVTSPLFWGTTLIAIAGTGILAGSYPAFYLSSFRPTQVLKGRVSTGKKASTPRKVLVTLQFGFSILLLVGTFVIIKQINLVQGRELGYDQENLINLDYNPGLRETYKVIKTELLQSGRVEGVTRSNSEITNIYSNNFLGWPGKPEEQRVIFTTIAAHYDYAETMGIEVLMGRDFSENYPDDSTKIIINKAGLELMDLENPIGTQLELWGEKRELIGVVDNVLMGSIYEPVAPLFIILDDWGGSVTLRLSKTNDLPASLRTVEEIFRKHNPAYPFEYTFVDDNFREKFTSIRLVSRLASIFAVLAIIITGLGLIGLASYMAEQRTKEIGIRKVLGATVAGIIGLMSKEFSRLVVVSFVMAAPVAWWLMNEYLERYTIRTSIPWWVFALSGAIALAFALLVVTTQSMRAARQNPARSLKSE